ncbi:MAG: hypothetical protein ACJ75B_10625 [Flavisolibacter sp.]
MKKVVTEKSIVLILFLVVLLVFSLAERDTRKIIRQYSKDQTVMKPSSTNVLARGQAAVATAEN